MYQEIQVWNVQQLRTGWCNLVLIGYRRGSALYKLHMHAPRRLQRHVLFKVMILGRLNFLDKAMIHNRSMVIFSRIIIEFFFWNLKRTRKTKEDIEFVAWQVLPCASILIHYVQLHFPFLPFATLCLCLEFIEPKMHHISLAFEKNKRCSTNKKETSELREGRSCCISKKKFRLWLNLPMYRLCHSCGVLRYYMYNAMSLIRKVTCCYNNRN